MGAGVRTTENIITKGQVPLFIYLLLFFFFFLGPQPQHMEVPRLGVESELQLPAAASATATAARDLSRVCDLHHSLQQCWILNSLSKARDQPASLWILVRFINC